MQNKYQNKTTYTFKQKIHTLIKIDNNNNKNNNNNNNNNKIMQFSLKIVVWVASQEPKISHRTNNNKLPHYVFVNKNINQEVDKKEDKNEKEEQKGRKRKERERKFTKEEGT